MRSFGVRTTELDRGRCRVTVVGEVDHSVGEDLQREIERAARSYDDVVVDLSGCDFIDSTGLSILIRAWKNHLSAERRFVLCGARDQVKRVLEVSGVVAQGLLIEDCGD